MTLSHIYFPDIYPTMKHFIAITISAAFFFSVMGYIPSTQAPKPQVNKEIEASIITTTVDTPIVSQFKYENPETEALVNILELYLEEERDLESAQTFLDQVPKTEVNSKILKLYQAKISSRSLDFNQAQELLLQVDDIELLLLKAAVLIASADRYEVEAYLHELIESHPNAQLKSSALALLKVYNDYNTHRDVDESYLWTLFAQKIGNWQEYEISLYLANKATNKSPNYRDAWIIKGYDELNLKKYEDAESSLLQAYKLDPGNNQIQYLLGLTYFELEKTDLSTKYLLYSLQNENNYQEIILEKLAENAISSEDYALAIHYFETLLEVSPENKQALSRLVWIYADTQQNFERAEYYAQKHIEYYNYDSNSYQLLSWIKNKKGELDSSLQALEQAKKMENTQP